MFRIQSNIQEVQLCNKTQTMTSLMIAKALKLQRSTERRVIASSSMKVACLGTPGVNLSPKRRRFPELGQSLGGRGPSIFQRQIQEL
jgi:hypothetical protein